MFYQKNFSFPCLHHSLIVHKLYNPTKAHYVGITARAGVRSKSNESTLSTVSVNIPSVYFCSVSMARDTFCTEKSVNSLKSKILFVAFSSWNDGKVYRFQGCRGLDYTHFELLNRRVLCCSRRHRNATCCSFFMFCFLECCV